MVRRIYGPGVYCAFYDGGRLVPCIWTLYYCVCVSNNPQDLCEFVSGTFPGAP